jgi:hypothetical protein
MSYIMAPSFILTQFGLLLSTNALEAVKSSSDCSSTSQQIKTYTSIQIDAHRVEYFAAKQRSKKAKHSTEATQQH